MSTDSAADPCYQTDAKWMIFWISWMHFYFKLVTSAGRLSGVVLYLKFWEISFFAFFLGHINFISAHSILTLLLDVFALTWHKYWRLGLCFLAMQGFSQELLQPMWQDILTHTVISLVSRWQHKQKRPSLNVSHLLFKIVVFIPKG